MRIHCLIGITLGLLFSSCGHRPIKNSGGNFRESAYHDGNQPPKSLQAKLWKDGDDVSRNGLYIQSQADYHFTLAEAFSNEGSSRQAIEAYRAAMIYDPNSAVISMRLAAEFLKLGILTEALEHAESAVKKDEKLVDGRLLLAGLYSSMRMYDSAIKQYKVVLQFEPNNREAPLYIGAVYAEQKKYDQAIEYFEQLLRSDDYPNKHRVHYYIGRLYVEKGDSKAQKAAEESFRLALKSKNNFDEAVLGLASLMKLQGRSEERVKMMQDWQREFGPSPGVAEALAQDHLENERYDDAFEQLKVVESFNPRDLNIKVKIALVLIEREEFQLAVGKLEQVITQVPDSDKIRFYLAAVYEELKDFDRAVENYSLIPPVSVFYSEAIVHRAYLHKVQGETGEAKDVLEEGLKHRRDIPQFYTLYASILDERKEYYKALDILQDGVKRFPGHVQIRFFLGSMYDKTGDVAGTVREMKKVTEIDERHVQALNYLAYTYAENRMNLEEAESLARKALEISPDDGYILDTLGWVLYKRGKYVEAIPLLEKAYQKQGGESVIAEHLGDAYYSQQLPEKAKRMYKIAARIATDQAKIRQIKEKIAAIEQQLDLGDRTPASQ